MTAADFASWVSRMKTDRAWSGLECARRLGCQKDQIKTWSERGAPAYIGLACAALAFGLPQWKSIT